MTNRLVVLCVVLTALGGVSGAAPPPTQEDEILLNGNFSVDIPGGDQCGSETVTVDVDPIEIEMEDVTQSNDETWRQIKPGAIHYGVARFTFPRNRHECLDQLSMWIEDALSRGDAARRTIRIALHDRRGRVARRYTLVDTLPLGLAFQGGLNLSNDKGRKKGDDTTGAEANLAELQVQPSRVEMDDGKDDSDEENGDSRTTSVAFDHKDVVRGFAIEISSSTQESETDSSWKTVTGGAAVVKSVVATVGQDGKQTFRPGKSYVTEITLCGDMTAKRKALLMWMQNTLRGDGDLRAELSITPVKIDGSSAAPHTYYDTLITRIKIPSLNSGSSDPIKEVVVLRPTRYNDPA